MLYTSTHPTHMSEQLIPNLGCKGHTWAGTIKKSKKMVWSHEGSNFFKKLHILAQIPVLGNLTHMYTYISVSTMQCNKYKSSWNLNKKQSPEGKQGKGRGSEFLLTFSLLG